MFRATIAIRTTTMTLEEIESAVGLSPDRFQKIGDPLRSKSDGTPRIATDTLWKKHLGWDAEDHGGTKGIWLTLSALGLEKARAFQSIASDSTEAWLDLVQEVNGEADFDSRGLHIPVAAIEWLNVAGMPVDIDQYFYNGD